MIKILSLITLMYSTCTIFADVQTDINSMKKIIATQQAQINILMSVVPQGAVMAFDMKECPSGWEHLAEASGRVIVGLHDKGALKHLVGSALSDKAERSISEVPSHSHKVNPENCNIRMVIINTLLLLP